MTSTVGNYVQPVSRVGANVT